MYYNLLHFTMMLKGKNTELGALLSDDREWCCSGTGEPMDKRLMTIKATATK